MKKTAWLGLFLSTLAFAAEAPSEKAAAPEAVVKPEASPMTESSAKQNLLTDDDRRVLAAGEIGSTPYWVGGAVGTVVGFGVGHIIQGHGRYSRPGWIFTVGEAVSAGIFAAGASHCSGSGSAYTYSFLGVTNCSSGSVSTVLAGALALAGFKVWEIVDLWLTPPEMNEHYRELSRKSEAAKTSYYLIPPLNGAKGTLVLGLSRVF